jgi:hypothetical protein
MIVEMVEITEKVDEYMAKQEDEQDYLFLVEARELECS